MSIARYISDTLFKPRLQKAGCLVVYDPDERYRDICLELASEELSVIDASESSIESREAALAGFIKLAKPRNKKQILVYVPTKPPVTDLERQRDPFSAFSIAGSVFPEGAGDAYKNICLLAKPDHTRAINEVFKEDDNPGFAVIDNVGGGVGWPTLQSLLGADGAQGILIALMAPSDKQKEALKENDAWVKEAKDLFAQSLSLKLRTRAKSWSVIAEELWRFVLFSEFSFDLPEKLPESLRDVPRAPEAAEPIVDSLCEQLRRDLINRVSYIERAEIIEAELNLVALCIKIDDLGVRDTFPFEERTFFSRAVKAIEDNDLDGVREILKIHQHSVWTGKGESQEQWSLIETARNLIGACQDQARDLSTQTKSLESLVNFYVASLREVDRMQREFEQVAASYRSLNDDLEPVIKHARTQYRDLIGKTQLAFTRLLEASTWPPTGQISNSATYRDFVEPKLKDHNKRVAYLMVDALRYELGVMLKQQLSEDNSVELFGACAQLPTVTLVGMASLLPGADSDLSLTLSDDDIHPMIEGERVSTVPQRMAVLRRIHGDRFSELTLSEFLKRKAAPEKNVSLLVLRSVEIDSQLENDPDTALDKIHDILKRIRFAVNKLQKFGFNEVVIATDHGFYLNAFSEAGDTGAKPTGNWVVLHDRSLLGQGDADDNNFTISADKVGIKGDFGQFGGPRTMAPYRRGLSYFHGGASLQEAIVPIITVKLEDGETQLPVKITLSYRNGTPKIRTRRPVFDLNLQAEDLFAQGEDFEIRLEAQKTNGDVVGETKTGGMVNAATGTANLTPGDPMQVILRMLDDFAGAFTVKVINPKTEAIYASLEMETDYAI
jgi:hypothetical protein